MGRRRITSVVIRAGCDTPSLTSLLNPSSWTCYCGFALQLSNSKHELLLSLRCRQRRASVAAIALAHAALLGRPHVYASLVLFLLLFLLMMLNGVNPSPHFDCSDRVPLGERVTRRNASGIAAVAVAASSSIATTSNSMSSVSCCRKADVVGSLSRASFREL
jgi:hypothetical protein